MAVITIHFSHSSSEQECDTADEIDETPCDFIRLQMSVDDVTIDGVKVGPNKTEFLYEQFMFNTTVLEQDGVRTVFLYCATSPDYEWRLNTQMRIKTGSASSSLLKVVDKDVFEFYPKCDPISVELMSDSISAVKFELRILNKLIEPLPTFQEGNLTVLFSDGSSIKVHRELVSLYSTYISKIYPTLRPLYRNMRDFAKAAVSYQAATLVYELSKHLVNYNTRSMSLEQKLKAALDLELGPAVEELVYRAAQDGVWTHLIKLGFEPEDFFGVEVYRKLVCPAILAGRQNEYGKPFIEKPFTLPDFFSDNAMNDPLNTTFVFRRTPFFVNRLLQALFTREMEKECARFELLPGEVPPRFLRAAIVFCHDHDWIHMKNQLEQNLLQQPPNTCEEYRDQIIFAEQFNLQNIAATCNAFAHELRKSDDFNMLSAATRNLLVDRLCSGWGLEPKHVNRLATREPSSFRERKAGLSCGGPRAFEEERQVATLAEMNSEYYFGPVGELCVVDS
ncbi:hypothetical protein COOONC_15885 [Cooperia oncophora]